MYKALIGAGALLLATAAVPVSAQAWDGNDNGYGYNNYDHRYGYRGYDGGYDYNTIRWHVRACQRHERYHEALNAAHEAEHDQRYGDYGEHRDVHQTLNEAHEEYHENHAGAHDCSYWFSQYYNQNRGYGGRCGDSNSSYRYRNY